jgi:heavy metal translocating P-type ATPase
MPYDSCFHCGLPVVASRRPGEGPVFCCYGCALASRIVGPQGGESEKAWTLLRLGAGALLAMNVMMISLLLYTGSVEPVTVPVFRWVMLGLATPAMLILVYPFAAGAAAEVRRGRLSLDTLIAVGSLAAFGASAAATVRGTGHVYFDTATMLPALVTFGKLIEATAKTRAGRLLRGLETLLPATALREEAGALSEVPVRDLRAGDRLRVRPGERIPADGRLLEGSTAIEEAAFTGEPRPRLCGPGDEVLAGTVNGPGPILVEARHVGTDLLVARMIAMVEQARRQASPSERIAQRAAAVFTPAVFVLAVGAGLYGFWADGARQAGFAALSVLVVACPCAMGIAAPLATALAIGRAARRGILVRGGDVLERVGQVRTVFFDKTGTVTAGRPTVAAVVPSDPATTPDEILGWLAGLESASEHALARAVLAEAAARGLEIGAARAVEVVPGLGLSGTVTRGGATREVLAGTAAFVRPGGPVNELDVSDGRVPRRGLSRRASATAPDARPDETGRGAALPGDGADSALTAIEVAWNGQARGRVLLSDAVRGDAAEAVRALRQAGVDCVLVSGDRLEAARAVADQVGIEHVEAPRRPEEKIEAIRAAQGACGTAALGCAVPRDSRTPEGRRATGVAVAPTGCHPERAQRVEGSRRAAGRAATATARFLDSLRLLGMTAPRTCGRAVAMVGDGINDAPALAAADVGIALGAGTDLARQAGHVVLLADRLAQIPWLVALSRRTRRIIRQNLLWAIGYNAVALAAAAAGYLHPLLAAVAMVISSLTVLANSLRLQSFRDG